MDISVAAAPISAFALDPAVLHLNHGSFGACPRAVLAAQDAIRARLEAAPMRFMVCEWQDALDAARARVAAFVGADPADLVMIPNATTGVSAILASLPWAPGDHLVVTDHGYRACRNAALRLGETRGVELVTVEIPVPTTPDEVVRRVVAAVDDRTRLVMVDHITSPTALVQDVGAICAALAGRVDVLVDGAHAPGQFPVDVRATGAAYYVANCHKWMCAPKGAALLWARRDRRDALRPLVTSHGETPGVGPANRFHARFDWSGTHDPSAVLAVPAAIDTVAALAGSWGAVHARLGALAAAARDLLIDAFAAAPIAPPDMTGTMAAIPIALPAGAPPLAFERDLLQAGIEVPIVDLPGHGAFVRVSAHLYNALPDYERLAAELLARGVRGRRP